MELHEWLQQLKDKVMSHLELFMQRGDIKGPPYVMPDNIELTFLRKFIERQAAGVPHSPRLRNALLENRYKHSQKFWWKTWTQGSRKSERKHEGEGTHRTGCEATNRSV
jgi:hypothetical protein